MATITYEPGNGLFAAPNTTFDITSLVAKRVGPYINYYSFDTDGTMFVLSSQNVAQPDGSTKAMFTAWAHYDGATVLQSATCMLDTQPFLQNLASRNPSSTKAMAYVFGGDDHLVGSAERDNMVSLGGNDTLDGASGNDHMKAGAGNDVLWGGAGADIMTGGSGADQFVFRSASEGGDKITDFAPGLDHLVLTGSAFGLPASLSEGQGFETGAAAQGAGPTLVYNPASGVLKYDPDGAGAATAITLVTLTHHPLLTASDVVLV